ncbi:hypothetical protein [Mucilaginibacter sp. UR6-11]|uniref:hypothetical protein n=1 Tax=Mucilaginibacter sp. UR6-11 TaxID=1435644 RepID=UPI001E3FBC80|nr:hypothetical protein [Mucilaginibacter sp. UR6-11]MCC8425363.1 hypothetical protein [Mucilaginibacter sp. UR6-11]
MKKIRYLTLLIINLGLAAYRPLPVINTIAAGKQPQVSVDKIGTVRVVYGLNDNIFCATSGDQGQTFSSPVLVAHVADMHLGMGRGPQLSSSANFSVITAIDKAGNIHWFKLKNGSEKWQAMGVVNDLKGSAPEGMMAVGADKKDNFYAVWLDIRLGQKNQIWFSSLSAQSNKWSANRLVYKSPDMHVCECCKPGISVSGSAVAIMFRNWLNGSRDLYVARSANGGQSFTAAQKMGLGTWKLDGCPMDGGGIIISPLNIVQTVWQRKGEIYFAQGADPEVYIGKGKTCTIAGNAMHTVIAYQSNDTLKLVTIPDKKMTTIGEGNFIKLTSLANGHNFCVWEQDSHIKYRLL